MSNDGIVCFIVDYSLITDRPTYGWVKKSDLYLNKKNRIDRYYNFIDFIVVILKFAFKKNPPIYNYSGASDA